MSEKSENITTSESKKVGSGKLFNKSRRSFLGQVGGLFTAAALFPEQLIHAQGSEKPGGAALGSAPVEEAKRLETNSIMEIEGLKVYLNEDGVPVSYRLNNGETKAFSPVELKRMVDARDLAEATGDVEVATQIIEYEHPEVNEFDEERPLVTVPPENILSPEQLAENNIEIINPSKANANTLELTSDILQGTGLLEPFRILNEHLPDEEKKKLIIAVLNGGFVTQELASDPAYDKVRGSLKEMTNEIRNSVRQQVTEYYQYMDFVRKEIQEYKDDPEFSARFIGRSLQYKSLIMVYTQTLSEEELINEFYFRNEHFYNTGQYHDKPFFSDGNETDSVIFIASPELKTTLSRRYYTINCASDGVFGINIIEGKDSFDGRTMIEAPSARTDQGFPQPDDVSIRSNRTFSESELTAQQAKKKGVDIYRYDFWSGGIVRHELVHYLLLNVIPDLAKQGLLDESECVRMFFQNEEVKKYFEKWGMTADYFPTNNNEAVTDQLAYDTLVEAWKTWEESGYTDASGFYVIFKVPESEFLPGGYQLTDAPSEEKQAMYVA